ncbi:MAG: class I adenylate cyclase [Deltaproteobacteria bacterium]|nr:class I adenylate cyclase [Deltaproteobacteria bacterium]
MPSLLAKNIDAFIRNNTARTKEFQGYASKGTRMAFLYVPILLHVNHPDIPGFINSDRVPTGLCGFNHSEFPAVAYKAFPKLVKNLHRILKIPNAVVQSLLVMGSVGTVGQTGISDLDYWVSLNQNEFAATDLLLFRKKLDQISAWALKTLTTEVHFYLVDIPALQADKLYAQGAEIEGEVAPLLVKEEFYRTGLYVVGRIPWWWVQPSGVNHGLELVASVFENNLSESKYSMPDFIDFGPPQVPGPSECLAAALWLSQKSEADPFKAALKMILIWEQVESRLQAPLLCDSIKKAVLTRPEDAGPVDPYKYMIRHVLAYAANRLENHELELLRIAAYYKVKGLESATGLTPGSPKVKFLNELIGSWGWTADRVAYLDNYSGLSHGERMELGVKIKEFLFKVYLRIAGKLQQDFPDEISGHDERLNQFKAGMLSRYSDHEAKVPDLPSNLQRQTMPQTMTLVYNNGYWDLYGALIESWHVGSESAEASLIAVFPQAARAAAWLIHNRLYTPELKLRLQPRPGPVSLEAMLQLLEKMKELFPPSASHEPGTESGFVQGGIGTRLLIINLEGDWNTNKIMSVDLVYCTAWGEMRHVSAAFPTSTREAEKYLLIAKLLQDSGKIKTEDLCYHIFPGLHAKKLLNNLRSALTLAMSGGQRSPERLSASNRKNKLDLD